MILNAKTDNGKRATLRRNKRQFSQSMITTLPVRKIRFETSERIVSAATRCASATSLLMRETISPSFVRA